MFITQIPTADQARELVPSARLEKCKTNILYAIEQGKSNCYVNFKCTNIEIASLEDLGYGVTISNLGATHISWF
jgi:hypothetical protein